MSPWYCYFVSSANMERGGEAAGHSNQIETCLETSHQSISNKGLLAGICFLQGSSLFMFWILVIQESKLGESLSFTISLLMSFIERLKPFLCKSCYSSILNCLLKVEFQFWNFILTTLTHSLSHSLSSLVEKI